MMSYIARVRYGNQELDVREFVLPRAYMVAEALDSIGRHDLESLVWHCWDWVCRNIKYPPLPQATADYHKEEAFIRRLLPWGGFVPVKRSTKWDFWQFPWETLDHEIGDCEDTSILLCSILRNVLTADQVYVAVGNFAGYGHAWVTLTRDGAKYVLEATLNGAFAGSPYQVLEVHPYKPLLYFNDAQAFEAYPGAWEEPAARHEPTKLCLIRETYHKAAVDSGNIAVLS